MFLKRIFNHIVTIQDELDPSVYEQYYLFHDILFHMVFHKVKLKFIPWKISVPVGVSSLKMPPFFEAIIEACAVEDFSSKSLKTVRTNLRKIIADVYAKSIHEVHDSDLLTEEKGILTKMLKADQDYAKKTWRELRKEEKEFLLTFTNGEIEYLGAEQRGSTTIYYMIKRLDILNVVWAVEVVKARKAEHILSIKQIILREDFVKAFIAKEKEN